MSADIFVSYASSDRERVRPLVEALQLRGWSVWWDNEITPGADFQRRIEQALAEARCVLVVWTAESVNSQWVRNEARIGMERQMLVPAMLDKVTLPLAFSHQNCARLVEWSGDAGHPEFERLAQGVARTLAGMPADLPVTSPGAPRPGRAWRQALTVALVAAAGFAALVVAWLARSPPVAQGPAPPANSIAVLPFANLGGAADAYRSEGLSLELLAQLARVRELAVVSPTSSFALERKTADIGRRLNVRYLVEGAVRPADAGATVDVRLVDATSYRVLWSDRRTAGPDALADLPRDLAGGIVAQLDVKLSEESLAELRVQPTSNPAALDQYLRGIALLRQPTDAQTLAAAEQDFRRAVEIDAAYAMPYAGLCRVQVLRYQRTLDAADFNAAEENCRHTLSLNTLQAEPHKALGGLYLASGRLDDAASEYGTARRLASRDGDALIGLADVADRRDDAVQAEKLYREAMATEPYYWRTHAALGRYFFGHARYAEAVTAYRRAIEIDPAHASTYEDLGGAYYMDGAFEDALAAWQKALAMEAGATAYSNVGTAYFFLHRYDDAVAMYRKAVEVAPRDHRWHGHLGDALRLAGQADEAAAEYRGAADLARENLAVDPSDTETAIQLAAYDAALGRAELATLALREALRLTPDDPYAYYDAAVAWANMGKTAQSLEALGSAVRLGYPRRLVAADPLFDPLRSSEAFRRLVQ